MKNYIGGSLEIKNDGKVIHKRSGEIVDDKQDIIEQSENHVTALTTFLEKNYPLEDMNWHDLVKGIVVISNDEMNIKNDSTYPIFGTNLVRPYILNMQNNVLSKNQIEEIKDLMIRTSKEDLKFPYMGFIDEFYQEDFLLAVTNKSVQFFEYYLEILDGVVDPINLSQSLVFYPVINDMGEFEIVTNEKDAGELKEKLKIIFNEENKDLVLDILTNNL